MTYEQAMDSTVTRAEAEAEIRAHGGETSTGRDELWRAFLAEAGDRPTYDGAAVLSWLGY
jgi:hypothetical protein